MAVFPVFLSVVLVVRNQNAHLEELLKEAYKSVWPIVQDFEIIVVDNASTDASVQTLKSLAGENGLPNLQVYALTKQVDTDTASWVGLENSLGDFVAVIDPWEEEWAFIYNMLEQATTGADVVFAINDNRRAPSLVYRLVHSALNEVYLLFSGINLAKDAPHFRVLSKRVVNFILQHPHPATSYRYLPATAGFTRRMLTYSSTPRVLQAKRLGESFDRGMRLLVSTTHAPMRLVTMLTLFGAVSNLVYSMYVVTVGLLKTNVAPGWISLSLQQSGMFFLLSLVLLVLSEYIINMVSLSNEGPVYHVAQEFTSSRLTKRERLNLEVVSGDQLPRPSRASTVVAGW